MYTQPHIITPYSSSPSHFIQDLYAFKNTLIKDYIVLDAIGPLDPRI